MKNNFRVTAMASIKERLTPVLARLQRVSKPEEGSPWDASYKLPDKDYPYSCTTEEGVALYYITQANGLRSGYEIATAFGVSSVYLALGLQANGGALLSVDCYVEETKESFEYSDAEIQEHVVRLQEKMKDGYLPEGLTFARESAALAGLSGAADFRVGVSPKDVPALLGDRVVDVALIDGGHFGDQPQKDFEALRPLLAPKCAVFFHDNNGNDSVARAIAAAERELGAEALVLPTYYGLTLVSRGLSPASLAELRALPKRIRPWTFRRIVASIRYRLGLLK